MAVAGDGSHAASEARKAGFILPDLSKAGCLGLLACLLECNLISNVLFLGFLALAASRSFSVH